MTKSNLVSLWVFFYYICSFSIINGVIGAPSPDDNFQILNSSDKSLTLQCTPQDWKIDSLFIDEQLYLRYTFYMSEFIGEPGSPMVPITSAVVGIPMDAQVRLSVLVSDYREIDDVRLAPVPTLVRNEELSEYVYLIDPKAYGSNEIFPSKPVEIAKIGFIRDQRIVGLRFSPLQVLSNKNRIRIYDKLIVRLDFIGGKVETRAPIVQKISIDESFYQGVILNYHQSKAWRVKPTKTLRKKVILFANWEWYKIPVQYEGIYQITGSFLKSQEIDLTSINPNYIKIFNNDGRELSKLLSASRPDSLIENAIIVVDGGDNRFDENDYILFYAQPVTGWDFHKNTEGYTHYINHYTEENIYWLTWNEDRVGKRAEVKPVLPTEAGALQSNFKARGFSELELNNLHNSGVTWYGPGFTQTASEHQFNIYLPGVIPNELADFKFDFLGMSNSLHKFNIFVNDKALSPINFNGNIEKQFHLQAASVLKEGLNKIKVQYNVNSKEASAYIDWFEIFYHASLQAHEDNLIFNAPLISSPARYQINGFSSNSIEIYDITDFADLKELSNLSISNQTVMFADSCDTTSPRKYIAITPDKYLTPIQLTKDLPSNLRNVQNGADYIIIYHADFEAQAQQLAEHRRQFDSLRVMAVNIQDVYDEFSWGLFDPVAIRDFLKFAYANWQPRPKFVLLVGDGDFDYKNIISDMDKNWIPPYETGEFSERSSRAMDDWYTYINGNDELMDLAIGRFTVRTPTEAQNLVDKIIAYDTNPYFGDWKNTITIVADDEYVGGGKSSSSDIIHITDAENLAEYYIPKTFNLKKIYLMEYPSVKSASISGIRKPRASEDLVNQINRGTLIVNYVGHGNEILWSHERLLTASEDLDKIENRNMLPVWIAATCAWGRYDMPESQSMSEELLTFKDRGAIAIYTAAREAYASPNAELNKRFFRQLFPMERYKWKIGKTSRLGEAIMKAKNSYTSARENNQKYHLFGDPAMRLAIPKYEVQITAITPDTIKALSKIRVHGKILKNNNYWDDYKGKIFLTAFDSQKKKSYTTEAGVTVGYTLPGNAIFRGPAVIENGKFDMSFIVPKDITYGGNLGRLSLYFWNDMFDGTGKRDSLSVGGTDTGISDQDGPEIRPGLKGSPLGAEVITGPKPILYAEIEDTVSGINITGEIGHTITLTLDGDLNNRKNATDFFVFDEGSWSKGSFEFPLANFMLSGLSDVSRSISGLTPGEHTIEVKAWDNFNNSSKATLNFTIVSEDKLVLHDVMNFPNPFSSETRFTFFVNQNAQITIKIYTVTGRLVKTLKNPAPCEGFSYEEFSWNGQDEDSHLMANGVYIYKILAKSLVNEDLKTDYIGRLVIMR